MISVLELEQIRGAIDAHKQGHELPCVANAPFWLEIMLDEIARLRALVPQPEEPVTFVRRGFGEGAMRNCIGYLCDIGLPYGHTTAVYYRDDHHDWEVVHIQSGLGAGVADTREGAVEQAVNNMKKYPLSDDLLDAEVRKFEEMKRTHPNWRPIYGGEESE